jgi:hypothetical protein
MVLRPFGHKCKSKQQLMSEYHCGRDVVKMLLVYGNFKLHSEKKGFKVQGITLSAAIERMLEPVP